MDQVIWRLPYGGGPPEQYDVWDGDLAPIGLACDDEGRLFAARWPLDGGAGSCVRIDYPGHDGIDMPSSVEDTDLQNPNGIAFVPGRGVYMTDSAHGWIVRYDEGLLDDYSITLAADDDFLNGVLGQAGANGLAYHAASEKLYVAISVPGLLYRYDVEPDGSLSSPEKIWDPPGMVITDGVAVDQSGEAYVSRYFGHEVIRVSDGQVMVSKDMNDAFETPASYAFRGGTLFITRYNLNQEVVGKLFAFDLGICGGAP